ncbi:MAG: hypothetical protein KA116_09940 [Proteobacteria bacterium]|nr:hypothetical protein [Pseudomonadota bacterium]
MSHIVWGHSLTPKDNQVPEKFSSEYYTKHDPIENCLPIIATDKDIEIPDPKAFRSMSRAALFLANVCFKARDVLNDFIEKNPFSVGIYCAVENGPIHLPTTSQLAQIPMSEFATQYKKLRNPKLYLKQLPNLAPAQMGIFMNVLGPMNVYTHSTMASTHAIDQAERDLENHFVDCALVCTAFSFEDPLITFRAKNDNPNKMLCEGAAALVLTKGGPRLTRDKNTTPYYFGISDEIIHLTKGLRSHV